MHKIMNGGHTCIKCTNVDRVWINKFLDCSTNDPNRLLNR